MKDLLKTGQAYISRACQIYIDLADSTNNHIGWAIGGLLFASGMTFLTMISPVISPVRHAFRMYYEETIPRVQTVDFNMLFHMLPQALSQASHGQKFKDIFARGQSNNPKAQAIRQILDSNYGVFSLVITDESVPVLSDEKQILYKTKRQNLKDILDEGHAIHTDLILYPHPVCNVAGYKDPKATDLIINYDCVKAIRAAVVSGKSKVVGRVHYIRGKTPDYLNNLFLFLQNFWGNESGYSFLRTSIYFTFSGWLLFFAIVYVAFKERYLQNISRKLDEERFHRELAERHEEIEKRKRQAAETEAELARARAELMSLYQLDCRIRSLFDAEFGAPIGNQLQIIKSHFLAVMLRLDNDVRNIHHDLSKASLLRSPEDLRERISAVLTNTDRDDVVRDIADSLDRIHQSFVVIKQLRDDLGEITALEPRPCSILELIKSVYTRAKERLPQASLIFEYQGKPLDDNHLDQFEEKERRHTILINPWHFRSILKNVIDNAYAACNREGIRPEIRVGCCVYEEQNKCIVTVQDNGPGIPTHIIDKIYSSPEKLNPRPNRGKGSMICFAYLSFWNASAKAENLDRGARVTLEFCLEPQRVIQISTQNN
ncbi:MAG: ATP-binding protein [Gloeomargarita sp. SKYG98]|nr:ATP-binding protein [Gloeomargarita sp. SKYG98]